jgi:hypothetical protein
VNLTEHGGKRFRAYVHGKHRAAFWRKLDYVNGKLGGRAIARPIGGKHIFNLTDQQWALVEKLAALEPGWMTGCAYLKRVALEHLDRESTRLAWDLERSTVNKSIAGAGKKRTKT